MWRGKHGTFEAQSRRASEWSGRSHVEGGGVLRTPALYVSHRLGRSEVFFEERQWVFEIWRLLLVTVVREEPTDSAPSPTPAD